MAIWLTTHQGKINDHESCAINLLNHPKVSEQFKKGYIEKLETIISSINDIIDKNLWKQLLGRKRISYTEENIIAYWSTQTKLDSVAICYINEFRNTIDFSGCQNSVSEAVLKEFFVSLTKCDDIRNKQYKECVVSLGFRWGVEFNVSGLSIEKVNILAENHILQMTPATLRFLRSNYPNAIPLYIESNFDEYTNMMTAQLIVQNELLMVLEWNVSDEAKKKLIDIAPSSISIVGQTYSPEISAYILQKKPHANDIAELYASYDSQPALIKDHMYSLAIRNIDAIIRGATKTTTELKCRILNDNQTPDSVKHRLLVSAIKTLSQADVMLCLNAIGKHEFTRIFNSRRKPKIEADPKNKEILESFKFRGWIASYTLSDDDSAYEIQRPTPPKKRALTHA